MADTFWANDAAAASAAPAPFWQGDKPPSSPSFGDQVLSAGKSFWNVVNPINLVTGMAQQAADPNAAGRQYGEQNNALARKAGSHFEKANELRKKGDYAGAAEESGA